MRRIINLVGNAILILVCMSTALACQAQEVQNLTDAQKAIVPIAAFTATGNLAQLETALAEGLEAGLTISEIKEVLVHSYAYAGFPRALNAIETFSTVLEQRKERGIVDPEGKTATPEPPDFDRRAFGHQVRNSLVGRDISNRNSGYAAFAPIIDAFLVEHLFSDLFAGCAQPSATRDRND